MPICIGASPPWEGLLWTEVPTGEEIPVKRLPDVWHLAPFERFASCKAIGV